MEQKTTYLVTGVDTSGKKFSFRHSNVYQAVGINLYNGRVWKIVNGKRILIKKVFN